MVDKIKPLKFETAADGTQTDYLPTEAKPTEDYVATKGIAFENLNTFLIEKLGRTLINKEEDGSVKTDYLVNGEINFVEYFNSNTQITANRISRVDFTYSGVDPLTEVWKIYDTNGTTVLRTITFTYSYSGGDISSASVSTT